MRGVAPLAKAAHRVTLGTGLLLHGAGDWLAPPESGTKFLIRSGGSLAGLVFLGPLLERAPHLIVGVPVVWAALAWHVSDSSATPPPGGCCPLHGEDAGHRDGCETTLVRREGLLIYLTPDADNSAHTVVEVREEVNGE